VIFGVTGEGGGGSCAISGVARGRSDAAGAGVIGVIGVIGALWEVEEGAASVAVVVAAIVVTLDVADVDDVVDVVVNDVSALSKAIRISFCFFFCRPPSSPQPPKPSIFLPSTAPPLQLRTRRENR